MARVNNKMLCLQLMKAIDNVDVNMSKIGRPMYQTGDGVYHIIQKDIMKTLEKYNSATKKAEIKSKHGNY